MEDKCYLVERRIARIGLREDESLDELAPELGVPLKVAEETWEALLLGVGAAPGGAPRARG